MKRGMISTINLNLLSEKYAAEFIHSIYEDYYKDEPFIRVLPLGRLPETKYVTGTNYPDIGLAVDKRLNKLIVVSALDNLGKGLQVRLYNPLIFGRIRRNKGLLSPGQFI